MKFIHLFTAIVVSTLITACGGGGSDAPENRPPVAQSGANQIVLAGTLVTLDGSGSSDPDNNALTYIWTLNTRPAGSAATLNMPSSAKSSFLADVAGVYMASLVVNDGKINSNAVTVTITASVANAAPVAHAGSAQNVQTGTSVVLDGSRSSDANGDPLRYLWSLVSRPAGSVAKLSSLDVASPSFTADIAGSYVATLVVNDGKLDSEASTVSITASVVNAAPVARAGAAQNVLTGSTVKLDGSGSSDADQDALTYQWTLTSKPANSVASLTETNSVKPSLVVDLAGVYVASLVVNDGKVNSAVSTVPITASAGNAVPVAHAGESRSVESGESITLDGSQSSDADGDRLTYKWTLVSEPIDSHSRLTQNDIAKPNLIVRSVGDYVVSLVVNDGKQDSVANTVTIKVLPSLGISLYRTMPTDPFTGPTPQYKQSFPYLFINQAPVCSGSRCGTGDVGGVFQLSARGQNYTVINLKAINLTLGSTLVPSFKGLVDGQNIADGSIVSFTLQAPATNGAWVKVQYTFTIQETGDTFSYTADYKTD